MSVAFGKKLKELRIEQGLSQQTLAQIFNVSKMTISAWETSKQEPKIDDIIKLAIIFNVTTDYLLGVEDESGRRLYKINNLSNFTNNGKITIN